MGVISWARVTDGDGFKWKNELRKIVTWRTYTCQSIVQSTHRPLLPLFPPCYYLSKCNARYLVRRFFEFDMRQGSATSKVYYARGTCGVRPMFESRRSDPVVGVVVGA